ncbi:Glycosyltransferase involved in cell wall bisynthesis [Kytococcus aerolatus]|uniref:Glycosyltransferase involved in cell wall bisynthesis n=1 Tax=Kytococcus aerolatus TaxID=592308 RepID=A0A212TH93_9MICO|nr:glycosyltransferase [Kytococcus aerolatus]SNC65345.1 Glycosyltransferase involved in cell wall bisynthesis [Kytococcus aerolatus]
MRVLVVSTVHHPGDARIRERQIEAMLAAGWQVTQAGAFSAHGMRPPAPTAERALRGIDLPHARGLRRGAALRAARRLLRTEGRAHDVVLLHDPELLLAVPGSGVADRVVWDVHEDPAAALPTRRYLPGPTGGWAARLVRLLERVAERHLTLLLAEHAYAERFSRPHTVVPNSVPVPEGPVPGPGEERVVYLGNVTRLRGAAELVALGGGLREATGGACTLHVIGPATGECADQLAAAHERGDLVHHGFVPNARAAELLPGALAGVSLLHDAPNFRHSMPTKVLEYMAHGLPVLTTPLPLAVAEVEQGRCGAVVPFGPAGVGPALEQLLAWRRDDTTRARLGAAGRERAVAEHSWWSTAPVFLDALRAVAGGAPCPPAPPQPPGAPIPPREHRFPRDIVTLTALYPLEITMANSTVPAALRDPARLARRAARRVLGSRGAAPAPAQEPRTPAPQEDAADAPAEELPTARPASRGLPAADAVVAVALSPDLAELMAFEWDQRTLDRSDREHAALEGAQLALLQLQNGLVPGMGRDQEPVSAVVSAARERSVPVALWVTSGPLPELPWLQGVDHLYASSPELRDEAAAAWGREVGLLEPAAQPRLANPVAEGGIGARTGQALTVVDGFSSLADGSALQEILADGLKPLPEAETPVVRLPGKSSLVTLPTSLEKRVQRAGSRAEGLGHLPRAGVLTDLSATSPQAAWTAVAAAASATPMVTPAGLGGRLPGELGREIPVAADQKHFRSEVVARMQQPELRSREGHLLHREVLAHHTAGHRAATLLGAAGVELPRRDVTVSAVVPTNREHELDNVFANIGRQRHQETELVLVLHGLQVDEDALRGRATEAGVRELVIVRADQELTLGACMNLGVDAASGRYVAKMDDDNFYGPGYLSDLVEAFTYTDASIVGKWCHLVWLRSTGAVVLRYPDSEHSYERRIQGGAMLFDGDLVRSVRFSDIPRAVDSDILDRSMAEGATVYSADRYNFVSIRGTDRTAHTWTVTDSTFMTATGDLQFYGDPRPHASL